MNLPAHGTTSPDPSVISVLKQYTKRNKNNNILPGPASTPPGEIVPDRLAVPAHRQAPVPFQRHCFYSYRLSEHALPPGAMRHRDLCSCSLAWRLSADH
ncbi:hypothetical protein DEO72_LG11g2063 [Vigna unguiculata]|uniref:Uncharacterized protein n=1 Tax=Vigna unguiculata TaxID=3917 RepID=A0A4D6NS14_VIGUN|nr:hypothetical protein DEO72_LG11g2063 [Vigna unguiculata]